MSRAKSRLAAVPLAALAVVLGIALNAERADAAFPGKNGKIAFDGARDGGHLTVGDFDRNGAPDLAVANSATEAYAPGGLIPTFSVLMNAKEGTSPPVGDDADCKKAKKKVKKAKKKVKKAKKSGNKKKVKKAKKKLKKVKKQKKKAC